MDFEKLTQATTVLQNMARYTDDKPLIKAALQLEHKTAVEAL